MAEHEDIIDHCIEEKLRALDESIRVPEIPDVETIFERAEKKKSNTVPFARYRKIITAAAAVVLVFVCIPVFGSLKGSNAAMEADFAYTSSGEPAEASDSGENGLKLFFSNFARDIKSDNSAEEPESAYPEEETFEETVEEFSPEIETPETEVGDSAGNYPVNEAFEYVGAGEALAEFFGDRSSAASSSTQDSVNFISDSITDNANKKRRVELTLETDSVSVTVFDTSAGDEIINAFWIEGRYKNSFADGDYYIVNLIKSVNPAEIENKGYLPMAGDELRGNYYIAEEDIFVPEIIAEGIIALTVEISLGTGEYKIYASII